MGRARSTCCVSCCKNTGTNSSELRFYRFPSLAYKLYQKEKWIEAVKKINGPSWTLKPGDTICSKHFIGNAKGEELLSPSFVPTIFSSATTPVPSIRNQKNLINRHKRYVQRVVNKRLNNKFSKPIVLPKLEVKIKEEPFSYEDHVKAMGVEIEYRDQECEAFFFIEPRKASETFICNRFVHVDSFKITCEAETQTEVFGKDYPVNISNRKLFKDVGCNTTITKAFEDKSLEFDIKIEEVDIPDQFILGIDS